MARNGAGRVVVRPARNGDGLFAAKAFRANDIIMKVTGRRVHHTVVWNTGGDFASNCYRYGPDTYLDPGDTPSRYVNHACEPNAAVTKVRHELFLFAATAISAGTEIVMDYSTILGDDEVWTMRCNCGRATCRGRIRRFGSLPAALKRRYLESGLVPKLIIRTLEGP